MQAWGAYGDKMMYGKKTAVLDAIRSE